MTDKLAELPNKINHLSIKIGNNKIGNLAHGSQYNFSYLNEKHEVSLTMPYRADPYQQGALHPVFSQNLPEGYVRRYIYERLARYAKVNDMYLLSLMGNRGIGSIEYDADIALPEPSSLSLSDILHWSGKDKLFPQLLDKFYLRGMASGVQPKVVLNAEIPTSRATAVHAEVIVKSFDEEFPLLTVNEFVCMGAAKHCGLLPPRFWLSDNLETFIIERFDLDEQGGKLGIEDFATLMGKTGNAKYQSSYESVLKVVALNTQSPIEVEKTFTLIAFNCLIGNGDAHLKNFSLQYLPNQTDIRLTPPYDITHTLIYDTIDNNMALKMRKSKAFPNKKELIQLAFSAGIQKSVAGHIIDKLAQGITDFLHQSEEANLLPNLKTSIMNHISHTMRTNPIIAPYSHVKKRKYE